MSMTRWGTRARSPNVMWVALVFAGATVVGSGAAAFGYLASGMTPVCAGCSQGVSRQSDQVAHRPGPVDIGFCQDMSVHHEQAVLMSIVAQNRAGPTVKALASSILVSQSQQIGIMRGWLQLWGKPLVDATPMAWMTGVSNTAGGQGMTGTATAIRMQRRAPQRSMPGMATPEELNQLWQRSGKAFDILFLQLMTRHHESGIMMARDAELGANLGIVRNTARVMIIQQAQDIAQMRRLLQVDGAQPLPFP